VEGSFFKRCNTCKGDIDFGADYYLCSVSTCNRKGTDFSFCSVECWEAHVPIFRHRDAWAAERHAPTAAPAAPAVAETPGTEPEIPRLTDDVTPAPLNLRDRNEIPRDILVVASKLKAYIRARSGMNTSEGVLAVLSDAIRDLCDDAIHRAAAAERKTVMDRDVPPPSRLRTGS
jgi:histone H3/H4